MQERKSITVIFMRHGFSEHNHFLDNELCTEDSIKYSPVYIDCFLHKKGEQECINVREKLNQYTNFKYAFISPLRRARQTAQLAMSQHPNLKAIPFYIHPLLREWAYIANDIPLKMCLLKDEVANFKYFSDWEDPFYFLKGFQNGEEMIEKYKSMPYSSLVEGIIEKMRALHPATFDPIENFRARVHEFIKFIRQFAVDNSVQDREILVVTHCKIIVEICDLYKIPYDKIKTCSLMEIKIPL